MRVTVFAIHAVLYGVPLGGSDGVRYPDTLYKLALGKHPHDSSNGRTEGGDASDSNAPGNTDLAAHLVCRLQSGSPPMV